MPSAQRAIEISIVIPYLDGAPYITDDKVAAELFRAIVNLALSKFTDGLNNKVLDCKNFDFNFRDV